MPRRKRIGPLTEHNAKVEANRARKRVKCAAAGKQYRKGYTIKKGIAAGTRVRGKCRARRGEAKK